MPTLSTDRQAPPLIDRFSMPWALHAPALATLQARLVRHLNGEDPAPEAAAKGMTAAPPTSTRPCRVQSLREQATRQAAQSEAVPANRPPVTYFDTTKVED